MLAVLRAKELWPAPPFSVALEGCGTCPHGSS